MAEPLQAVIRDIVSTAQQTRATLTETIDAVQAITRDLQQTGESLASAAEKSEGASQRFIGVDASLGKVLDDLVGRTQEAIEPIQKYVLELDRLFSESIDRLAGGIENLGEMVEGFDQRVTSRSLKAKHTENSDTRSEQESASSKA